MTRSPASRLGVAAAAVLAGAAALAGLAPGADAHSVSVGYVVSAPGTVTIYYGSYHAPGQLNGSEGTVTLTRQGGGYTQTKPNSATYTSRPSGLVAGINNHFVAGYNDSNVLIWQSATFTGVPSGVYSIQLTGSFSAVWAPLGSGISSPTSTFTIDATPPGSGGQVVLKVVSSGGDATFQLTSATPALNAAVPTAAGSGQTSPLAVEPGTHVVTLSLPEGFGLTSVACSDADSTGSTEARSATIVLAATEAVTCTFTVANPRRRTIDVISRLMSRRNDLLLTSGPDPQRQIDRLSELAGAEAGEGTAAGLGAAPYAGRVGSTLAEGPLAAMPVTPAGAAAGLLLSRRGGEDHVAGLFPPGSAAHGALADGGPRLAFSISLRQYRQHLADADDRKEAALESDGLTLQAGGASRRRRAQSPFDIWVEGQYLDFSDDRARTGQEGHFGLVYVGTDYVLASWLLVGALVQLDSLAMDSARDGYGVRGQGWMAGPYFTARLTRNVFLQGRAAWGASSNEASPYLTYTDSFDTRRWLASAALVGHWEVGSWLLRPSAALSYIEDRSEAYVDSLGVAIPSIRAALGQLKVGPEIAYRMPLSPGVTIEPRLGAHLIWNFESSARVVGSAEAIAGHEEVRGRIEAGVRAQMPDGIIVDVSATYDGIGSSSYNAVGGRATARVPLN